MKLEKGDVVTFKLSLTSKETFNGVVVSQWNTKRNRLYEIASMNHGMCSFHLSAKYILKKLE